MILSHFLLWQGKLIRGRHDRPTQTGKQLWATVEAATVNRSAKAPTLRRTFISSIIPLRYLSRVWVQVAV